MKALLVSLEAIVAIGVGGQNIGVGGQNIGVDGQKSARERGVYKRCLECGDPDGSVV